MPKNRFGRPSRAKSARRAPVGLGDDADAESLRLQHAADDRHAEARMVDVGVAGDDDDVAAVPAERLHFLARHGQERGGPEAGRPVLAIGEEVAGGKHGDAADGARTASRRDRWKPRSTDIKPLAGPAASACAGGLAPWTRRANPDRRTATASAPSPRRSRRRCARCATCAAGDSAAGRSIHRASPSRLAPFSPRSMCMRAAQQARPWVRVVDALDRLQRRGSARRAARLQRQSRRSGSSRTHI